MQRLLAELRHSGVSDEKVLAAVGAVDRERFVSPTFAERAWDNTALPISFGQTISQPLVVAAMTEALKVGTRMKVLEIGTGSGYQAAVLAKLARRVYSVERYKPLSKEAEKRLIELGIHNVVFDVGDGSKGWPGQAPFDRIIVTAAADERPQALIDQLAVGGILIVPVGRDPTAQVVERIVKSESGLQRDTLMPVRFVPQVDRVHAMLAADDRPAGTVIAKHPATGLELSLHAAAVNAVMAGCLPTYFPVLVAAFEAMDREPFNFHGSTASTGGSAPMVLVSGPLADEIGMNADVNLFGPGNRPNASIGRATRLILRNVFQMLPGISDKSTQGNPGKYSFCIAERARGNPWPLLCEAQGYPKGTSSVTVYAGGGFCNVENHGGNTPEQILGSVADAMANYGCITLGQSVVILAPEHMKIVGDAGWSRKQAQEFLFTHAKRSIDGMKGVGKF